MLAILDSEEPPEAARQALNLAGRPVSMEQVVQDVLPLAHDRIMTMSLWARIRIRF